MKKINIYKDRKNLYKFFKEDYYIYQEFVKKSNYKVYRAYKDIKESYSKIFANINIIVAESTHYCHECKASFASHNKLHNYIQIECNSLALLSRLAIFKDGKSIIIKSVVKLKELFKYSFRE